MDISLFIAELLHQHDEVNVPFLGTFFRQRKPGFYDSIKGVFVPPSQQLSFKVADTETTLLADYISQCKNISVSSANYFIDKYVSQVQELLEKSGRAELTQLGTLKKNQGQYDLQPFEEPEEDSFFGLKPIAELKIETAPPAPVEPKLSEVSSVKEEALVPETAETEVIDYAAQTPVRRSKGKFIYLFLGLLILAGGLTYFLYPQAFETVLNQINKPAEQAKPSFVKEEESQTLTDSLAIADTIYDALQKQGFEIEKPRDTLAISSKTETLHQPENITYEIIVAAFSRQDEAEAYIKHLKSKGIDAKIVTDMPGSKIKISLGTFKDGAAAERELARIQNDINKDAWIARVKPKNTN
ncbi:MAG TPA: SPOR domain-containing protein [Daejeonella sp.]|nr:SPOR domain-containing protein [Daejeonella sp.]